MIHINFSFQIPLENKDYHVFISILLFLGNPELSRLNYILPECSFLNYFFVVRPPIIIAHLTLSPPARYQINESDIHWVLQSAP